MTQIQTLKLCIQKLQTERGEEVDELTVRIKKLEKDANKAKTEMQDKAIKISGLTTEKQHLEARNKSLQSRKVT
jgi:chromosome segregation ATPase